LLVIPTIASAAQQQLTLAYVGGGWFHESASPSVLDFDGNPLGGGASTIATTKRGSDALRSLHGVNGQHFRCSAKAYLAGTDGSSTPIVAISALNTKNCWRSVVNH
jgi:hypothetical protein